MTAEREDQPKWGLIPISFGVNFALLYVPYIWLVAANAENAPKLLRVFFLLPGAIPAYIAQSLGAPVRGVWEYIVSGLASLMILLLGTAIGSINRATLVLSAILMLGYATWSVLAIQAVWADLAGLAPFGGSR